MVIRNYVTALAVVLISAVVLAGCQGMFSPGPTITKFQHSDYSYGTTHDVDSGDSLSFTVEGEMPGAAGTLEVIADKDGSETVLLEEEIATEEIMLTSLSVRMSVEEEGKYEVFARATTAEGKVGESAKVDFDVSVVSAEGLYMEPYAVAEIDDTFTLNTRTTPIGAPSEDVTFASNDSGVVSVSGDTLTAVGGGIATITATSDSGFTAEAKVYVEPSNADGGTTNPWVWDVNASNTEKSVTVGNQTDYYLVPVTSSALYIAYDGDAGSAIEYEVRDGNQWVYGDTQGSGKVEESDDYQMMASDLEPGFYMVELVREDTTQTGMAVDLNLYSN